MFLIEAWRSHYNTVPPHGSLGHRSPAPETTIPPSWSSGPAPPVTQIGSEANNALSFNLDQSVGAGQGT